MFKLPFSRVYQEFVLGPVFLSFTFQKPEIPPEGINFGFQSYLGLTKTGFNRPRMALFEFGPVQLRLSLQAEKMKR